MSDFLGSDFSRPNETLAFSHAMLSEPAIAKMQAELRKLRQKFAELHEESLAEPLDKRRGTGIPGNARMGDSRLCRTAPHL